MSVGKQGGQVLIIDKISENKGIGGRTPVKYKQHRLTPKQWAHILATTLEHLGSRSQINDDVKDAILTYPKTEKFPNQLSIANLWSVSAAEPGLLTKCMENMCEQLEEKVSKNSKIFSEDIKYAKEFWIMASYIGNTYMQVTYNI